MKNRVLIAAGAALIATAVSLSASAKATADEATRLKSDLTPVGAEKAGNKEGTLPAWEGGLTQPPAAFKGPGSRYVDPFPEDQPQFSIARANLEKYKAKLAPGQLALFARFPDTYRMNVYVTRRTFANPQFIYDATFRNATSAELGGNGEVLAGAITGVPFPIPQSGYEVIWNHKVRFRDLGVERWNNQFAVTAAGDFNLVKLKEDLSFVYSRPDLKPEALNNKIFYMLQVTLAPPRLAGALLLVHETMDPIKEARGAWQYNPGQGRLRRAPNIAYDNPGTAFDGFRTNDQLDVFNGAMDRYDWTLAGKRELYVPANSYRLHSDKLKYKDIVKKGHLNQDLPRYELRRVWVVDSTLKKNASHLYPRRTFYVDEDSWQIVAVDVYDNHEQLWRVQEAHSVVAYDKLYQLPVCETVYDLQADRYLVETLNNEDPETVTKEFDPNFFDPANVSKLAAK